MPPAVAHKKVSRKEIQFQKRDKSTVLIPIYQESQMDLHPKYKKRLHETVSFFLWVEMLEIQRERATLVEK